MNALFLDSNGNTGYLNLYFQAAECGVVGLQYECIGRVLATGLEEYIRCFVSYWQVLCVGILENSHKMCNSGDEIYCI